MSLVSPKCFQETIVRIFSKREETNVENENKNIRDAIKQAFRSYLENVGLDTRKKGAKHCTNHSERGTTSSGNIHEERFNNNSLQSLHRRFQRFEEPNTSSEKSKKKRRRT